MAEVPRIFLAFNGAWLEIDASFAKRRGGLRAITREAESKWNLQPHQYELRHASGKVDSPAALQRALENANNGVCQMDISESLEGKMMRTMHTEMQRMEERVMAKVDAALTDIRSESGWSSSRLSGSIAPLVQTLAHEQIELRNKVSQLSQEVDELAPARASVAAENSTSTLKDSDTLERELQQECALQAACDLDLSTAVNQNELENEVSKLGQRQEHEADRTVAVKTAPQRGYVAQAPWNSGSEDSVRWPLTSSSGIPYSSKSTMFEAKWRPGEKWSTVQLGNDAIAPFAQSIAPPIYTKSSSMHRSCPVLPPLY